MSESFSQHLHLLYVEDEDAIRNILSKRLGRIVKDLSVAQDGQDGYEKFCENQPDLILTDITMPKLNGIEMVKKIREIDKNIPIIVLSAHVDSKYLLEAIESGVSGYLLKPIDKEKLYSLIETHAKNIHLEKVNKEQQKQIVEQQSMLQRIIDSEKSISFVSDFKSISFANKSFLKFFGLNSIENFKNKFLNIEDIFIVFNGYINKQIIQYENNEDFGLAFYEKVEELDETKRIVLMLDKSFNPKSFYINISILDKDKNIFLINLTDITKMTIEKMDTEKKAYHDGLTGVYNRNKLEEVFPQELLRIKRYEHPLSIAILDIDHFKKFNDTYGHLIGDEVLILIAHELQKKIRETDILVRWGGEEFVILFLETALEDSIKKANSLREHIEELNHKTAGKITVSFGVTQYIKDDTIDSIFKRCDDALYKAKENGRNRVEFN